MRNPNGYGGISKLSGNRRRPYRVKITTSWDFDEKTGKMKQKCATLGYYATRKEAMVALAEYHKNPYDLDRAKVTFGEVYEKWAAEKFPKMKPASIGLYKAAYKKLAPIKDMKLIDLKKKELQAVLDDCSNYSTTMQSKIKAIMRAVFTWCLENDYLDKDYSQFVSINAPKDIEQKHKAFTKEEIQLLWDNVKLPIPFRYSKKDVRDIYPVDLILIMIYTGLRPGELLQIRTENVYLEKRYMVGGLKTEAGKDRIIPIHEKIFPLIKARYEAAGEWLVPYKSDHPLNMNQYRNSFFDPVMDKLDLKHLPHDGRHTFATFADRSNLKDHHIQLIMGHKVKNFTKDVYTDVSAEDLIKAVNKIVFVGK